MSSNNHRQPPPFSPAAERNKDAILQVLKPLLPDKGLVLETSSGSGQHLCHFARAVPDLQWQPSERDAEAVAILARGLAAAPANVLPPVLLDVCQPDWPALHPDLVYSANMAHIAPWAATAGLLAGAAEVLPDAGLLVMYGPYQRNGQHTADSNAAFHHSLRQRNPAWGIRHLEEVAELAASLGLELQLVQDMPANNLTLVYQRQRR